MYTIIQVGQICLAHPPAILTLAPALAPSRCPLSPRARCRRQEARASAGLVPPLAPAPRPRRRPRHSAYCRRRRPRAPAPTALRPCIVLGQIGTASFQSAPLPAARVDAPPTPPRPRARSTAGCLHGRHPQFASTLRLWLVARPSSPIRRTLRRRLPARPYPSPSAARPLRLWLPARPPPPAPAHTPPWPTARPLPQPVRPCARSTAASSPRPGGVAERPRPGVVAARPRPGVVAARPGGVC